MKTRTWGVNLMTLRLLVHWATLPLLMWPILVVQYSKLAWREKAETDVGGATNPVWREYRRLLKADGTEGLPQDRGE